MKIYISIFNYQRQDMLNNIIDEIESFLSIYNNVTLDYIIIDDGSDYTHSKMIKFEHTGKKGYWKKWDYVLKSLKDTDYDAYIFIPNDIMNIDFKTILKYTNLFKDNPYVLNITTDDRITCWNNHKPIKYNNEINRAFFTDCGFICNYEALKALDFHMLEINDNRFNRNNISSGVGQQLTQRFIKSDIPIYIPNISLSYHGQHISLMHPTERLNNPLISTINKKHKVICGIATMNTRKDSLKKVIESLNKQTIKPDKIYIYNNDENDFNATDNGKFYYFENDLNDEVYYFSMDDDILYPRTYIQDMIYHIDRLETIVTHHGRILNGPDLNYYSGHKGFSCLNKNTYEGPIDIAGTGVTAFHTGYFKANNIFNSQYKRMSDVVFSLEAAKQNKTITVLKHNVGYITDICDDHINSCFNNERKNPINQIELCNEIIKIKENGNN